MNTETVKKRVIELMEGARPIHDKTVSEVFGDSIDRPYEKQAYDRRKDMTIAELLCEASRGGTPDPNLFEDANVLSEIKCQPFNPIHILWPLYEAGLKP